MAKMNFTPADDLVNEAWGEPGTPERDKMEAMLEEEVNVYRQSEAFCPTLGGFVENR